MLKNFLHKSFTIILAVAILFSATGITVFKMVCSKDKSYSASLLEFDNCCKKNKAANCALNKSCCDFSKDTITSVQQYAQTDGFEIHLTEIELPFFTSYFKDIESNLSSVVFLKDENIHSGQQILLLASCLLI